MNRYTVVWSADVSRDFAGHWIASDSSARRHLTETANLIDRELAVSSTDLGTPMPSEPGFLLWDLPSPFSNTSVVYEVVPEERLVRVMRIMQFLE